MRIITNNHTRHLTYWHDLPRKWKNYFLEADPEDYAATDYVKAYGRFYSMQEIERAPDTLKAKGWDGVVSLTAFYGIVFRFFDKDGYPLDGGDSVIIGSYVE